MKKSLKILIQILICLSFLFPSYSFEYSKSKNEIDQAVKYLYNYDLDSSLYFINIASNIDKEHPLVPFLKSSVLWLKTQSEEGFEESYEQIKKSFDEALPIYKGLIKKYPNDPEYFLYLGSLYGLIARIELSYNHWFRVLIPALRGYRYIHKAYEIDSELKDIYMPMGLVSYYTCLSAPFIKFCYRFIGIKIDCDSSLEYLEIASTESYYSWIEANNVLSYIYLYMQHDYNKAIKKLNPLINKYPNHPFFPFLKAEALLHLKQWEKLDNMMPLLIELTNHKSAIIREECSQKLKYINTYRLFYNKKFKEVIKSSSDIIENYSMEFNWLLGMSYYLRANSYIALNEIDKAKKDLKIVCKLDFKFPEVELAHQKLHFLSNKK